MFSAVTARSAELPHSLLRQCIHPFGLQHHVIGTSQLGRIHGRSGSFSLPPLSPSVLSCSLPGLAAGFLEIILCVLASISVLLSLITVCELTREFTCVPVKGTFTSGRGGNDRGTRWKEKGRLHPLPAPRAESGEKFVLLEGGRCLGIKNMEFKTWNRTYKPDLCNFSTCPLRFVLVFQPDHLVLQVFHETTVVLCTFAPFIIFVLLMNHYARTTAHVSAA